MTNVFQATRNTWPEEWDNPDSFILSKTVGFWGIMDALPGMIKRGKEEKNLSIEFFAGVFERTKSTLETSKLKLNSNFFESSAAGARKFKEIILENEPKKF